MTEYPGEQPAKIPQFPPRYMQFRGFGVYSLRGISSRSFIGTGSISLQIRVCPGRSLQPEFHVLQLQTVTVCHTYETLGLPYPNLNPPVVMYKQQHSLQIQRIIYIIVPSLVSMEAEFSNSLEINYTDTCIVRYNYS